jgi:hypothetical protein
MSPDIEHMSIRRDFRGLSRDSPICLIGSWTRERVDG